MHHNWRVDVCFTPSTHAHMDVNFLLCNDLKLDVPNITQPNTRGSMRHTNIRDRSSPNHRIGAASNSALELRVLGEVMLGVGCGVYK